MSTITKILSALLLSAATGSLASANEPIQYYSLTSATTPHLSITDSWIADMRRSFKIDWYSGLSCGGKTAYQNDKRPKMIEFVSGRFWQSLDEDNTNCTVDLDSIRYISILEYTYDICVSHDSKLKSLQDIIMAPRVTMSFGSGTALHKWASEVNRLYGANIKPVVFKASGAAMLGALAGDTDFAFVASLVADQNTKSGKARCFATTMSGKSNSLEKILPKVDPLLNGHVNLFPLAASGVDEQTLAMARKSVSTISKTASLPPGVSIFVAQDLKDEQRIKSRVQQQINQLHNITKNIK